jgi:hypothetical protein
MPAQQGRRVVCVCVCDSQEEKGHRIQSPAAGSECEQTVYLNAGPYSGSAKARAPYSSSGSGMLNMTSVQQRVCQFGRSWAMLSSWGHPSWMSCCVTIRQSVCDGQRGRIVAAVQRGRIAWAAAPPGVRSLAANSCLGCSGWGTASKTAPLSRAQLISSCI